MSDKFLLGPNGVEEVEMGEEEEEEDEIEEHEALTQAFRQHPAVRSIIQRLESGQLPKSESAKDVYFYFREFPSRRLVMVRKSKILAPEPAQQTDQDDGLVWPQITAVRGAIDADAEVGGKTNPGESQLGANIEVHTESDANAQVPSKLSVETESERLSPIKLQDLQEFSKSNKNKRSLDIDRTLVKLQKIDKALAEGGHIPEFTESNMEEDFEFESDDNDDIDDDNTQISDDNSPVVKELQQPQTLKVPKLSQELEDEKNVKLPNQVQNSQTAQKTAAKPQTEGSTDEVNEKETDINGVGGSVIRVGESQMKVEQNNTVADSNAQPTEDNAGNKAEQSQLSESEASPSEIIVPGQLKTLPLHESSEKETTLRNTLAEELSEIDDVPQENNVPEQLKIEETTYFMDLEPSDSEQDEEVKVELVNSEEPSEVESIKSSCDNSASSQIPIQHDSESGVEMSICESQEQPIVENIENQLLDLPPPLEFGPGEIVPKTEMPILEQLDIPLTALPTMTIIPTPTSISESETSIPEKRVESSRSKRKSLKRQRKRIKTNSIKSRPKNKSDVKPQIEAEVIPDGALTSAETPEAEISEANNVFQPKNQNQQNDPNSKSSPKIKKNNNKRKLHVRKRINLRPRQDRPWSCPRCGKLFPHTDSLNKHMYFHHTKATCVKCNLTFDRVHRLTCHTNNVHTGFYPCTKCPSTFTYPGGLSRHLWRVHKISDYYKTKTISCYFCSHEFFSYSNLSSHMYVHTNEKAHRCPICDKDFVQKNQLHRHLAAIHKRFWAPASPPTLKKYTCPFCPFCCKRVQELKVHMNNVHFKLKPFECDLCDARFGRKATLTEHKLIIHANKGDFVCDRCGKRFAFNSKLEVHVQAVHEKMRHQCPHCDRNYSQRGHVLRHVKNAHTDR